MKTIISILILINASLFLYGQECCESFRNDGLAHYRAGRYEDAINNYLAGLNCPDKESCTDLPKLIKQALDSRVYELNKARNESEAATRRAMANDIIYKAQNENDRTTSFRLAELAWRIDPGNPKALAGLVEAVYNRTGPWADNFVMDAPMQGPEGNLVVPYNYKSPYLFETPGVDSVFSPGNRYLITKGSVWDINTGKELYNLFRVDDYLKEIKSIHFSSDENNIIVEGSWGEKFGSGGFWIRCLNSQTGQDIFYLSSSHPGKIFFEFFPGDNHFIGGPDDKGNALIMDPHNLEDVVMTLSGHTAPAMDARFVRDGNHLIIPYNDGTAKIWEFTDQGWHFDLSPNPGQAPVSPFGNYLKAAAEDFKDIARKWPYSSGFTLVFERADSLFNGLISDDKKWKATLADEQTLVISDASTGEKKSPLLGHHGRINSACFGEITDLERKNNPSGASDILGATPIIPVILTASDDHTAVVWNAETGEKIWTLEGHSGPVIAARFINTSGIGRWIATVSNDHTVKIWDTDTRRELWTLGGHKAPVIEVQASSNLDYAITSTADQTVNIWHMGTGKLLYSFDPYASPDPTPIQPSEKSFAHFSPTGDFLIVPSENHTAKVWKWWKGQEPLTLEGHSDEITDAAISSDGRWVATASKDHTAKVWNAQTGQLQSILSGHIGRVNSVCFRDSTILTSSDDQTAIVWDGMNGEKLLTLRGHTDKVNGAQFSPDGKWILTASDDRTARVWDASSGKEIHILSGHRLRVNSICLAQIMLPVRFVASDTLQEYVGSPSETTVAITSSDDHTAIVWNALTGEKLWTLTGHTGRIKDVKLFYTYSDNANVLTISDDHTARIWNASTGLVKHALEGHTAPLICTELDPDNLYIATASEDQTVKVWDAATGQLLHSFSVPSDQVTSIGFSFWSKYVLADASSRSLQVWPVNPKLGHFGHLGPDFGTDFLLGKIEKIRFSPDEKNVLSISENFGEPQLKIWDVESEKEIFSEVGNYASASFSSDGKYLLATTTDKFGEIFNWETGEKKQNLDRCSFLMLSPNGKQIIAGTENSVRVIDIVTGEEFFFRIGPPLKNAGFSSSGEFFYLDFGVFCEVWNLRESIIVFKDDFMFGSTSTEFSLGGNYFLRSKSISMPRREYINFTTIKNLKNQKEFSIKDAGYATFSPDSKSVLTIMHLSSKTGSTGIKIWDLESESEILSFPGKFQTARFSPDGRYILTTSQEGPAKVWDAKTGEEILAIAGILDDYNHHSHIQWSQDGKRILASTADGSIKIYLISGDELIEEATRRLKMGYFTPGQIKLYGLEAAFPYAGLNLAKLAAAGEEEKMRSIAAYYELQGDQISNKETSREYYEKALQFYKVIVPIARRYAPETYRMWIGKVEKKLEGLSGHRY